MSQPLKIKLSSNISIEIKKKEFREELEKQLKGVDITHNFSDIVETTILYAEEFFADKDLKSVKKEAVTSFLQQFTTKNTLELSSQIERVIRKKINKRGLKHFLLNIFRFLL